MKKTSNRIAEYMLAKADVYGIPISGTFELTPNCNLNCKMCYVKENSDYVNQHGGLLSKSQWLEIIDHAKAAGLLFVLFTGGEPLLHPEFKEIYEGVAKNGLYVSLNTNGTLIDEETLQLFNQYRPRRINISLYGASSETYKRLCGSASAYDKVIKNIELLHEMGINLCIHVTLTPENEVEFEKIVAYANALDIPVEATSYMFPAMRRSSGQEENYRFNPAQAAQNTIRINRCLSDCEDLKKEMEAYECARYTEGEKLDYSKISCRAGTSVYWVTWDGKMTPCGMLKKPQYSIFEETFNAAWDKTREFVKSLRLSEKCASCKKRPICTVCAAKALSETGSFQGTPDYLCQMTDAVEQILHSQI